MKIHTCALPATEEFQVEWRCRSCGRLYKRTPGSPTRSDWTHAPWGDRHIRQINLADLLGALNDERAELAKYAEALDITSPETEKLNISCWAQRDMISRIIRLVTASDLNWKPRDN